MQIKYFQDSDTLLFNFNDNEIAESKNLNENKLNEPDKSGNIISMTLEHAKKLQMFPICLFNK
ncbi:MAG: DUF2283 domain-containing protein [Bacteroidetes bacterium]|nr:MAG: DUF2283 domain-containing protein [Bacteroidota bacterium]